MPPLQGKETNPLVNFLLENRDVLLPIGVIVILLIMIVPVPPMMIDFFLTLSIAGSLLILFVGIYMLKPLDFSVFPSLLLLVTLFRLSLNIATTRQILLRGSSLGTDAAGKIINTFGEFVIQGQYLVGGIIFLILVIINFVVITKGAGRIAEVSARFTLDAMPGKQMSIDADLNAGLINEEQARERRSSIEQEADFYGAMDGASKFVRGDAVAGLIITGINIIGGLVVGVFQQNMALGQAARTYTLLTVGDGLVSQIPSLIVSTAAGIVVTRAASESALGETVTKQFLLQPRALYIAASILVALAMVPGMPFGSMGLMAVLLASVAFAAQRSLRTKALVRAQEEADEREAEAQEARPESEVLESILTPDMVSLEVGYGLIPLVDAQQSGELLERIKSLRRQFALDMGFIVPAIHIRDNLELKPAGYSVLVKGSEVAAAELMTNHLLAMSADDQEENPLGGILTTEPAFGLPAVWIPERDRERAQSMGYTVVNLATVIATHLTEVLRQHAHELLTRQETQKLMDSVQKKYPKVVEGVVPEIIDLGTIQKVLQNLLRERVSIRDLLTILETLTDRAQQTHNADQLTEFVRQSLSRTITHQYTSGDGKIYLMMLDQEIEDLIARATQQTEQGTILALEPAIAQRVIDALQEAMEQFNAMQAQPILACLPHIRLQLRRLTEKFLPNLIVLSHNEIAPTAQIESLGIVRVGNSAPAEMS